MPQRHQALAKRKEASDVASGEFHLTKLAKWKNSVSFINFKNDLYTADVSINFGIIH